MANFSPPASEGKYLPETGIYNTQVLESIDINSDAFRDYLVRLQQSINEFAITINQKSDGTYSLNEEITCNLYFSSNKGDTSTIDRQEYHTVVNFGALPNGVKAVAHNIVGINGTYTATAITGAATNSTTADWIPLSNPDISILVDATNVTITTTADLTAYDRCIVDIRYLKSAN